MKNRRKGSKQFFVEIDSKKMQNFENFLIEKKKTKKEWLNEKIDEELSKDVENKK